MDALTYIVVGLFGLAVGSFLNVVIYRVPRKIGFVLERSACPHCGKLLKWYHNIPLVSFIFLRGRCAFCSKPISWRYPLVELANSLAYLYFYSAYGPGISFVAYAFVSSALLTIFLIDLEFQIIPDMITVPGMVLGLAASLAPHGIGIINSLIGLVVGGGTLYLIALLGDFLFKKESMGGGDIKMAAMLGAFVGWQKVLLIFMSSAVIGLVVSVGLMAVSARIRRERIIPFGPFLALAAMLAIVCGDQIIRYYLHNILGLQ
jgi:leader peptidase (prepilin peptidase)/N-methyltransferase